MGALNVARSGPQGIELDHAAIREQYQKAYGEGF
jgi:hypothetical protein